SSPDTLLQRGTQAFQRGAFEEALAISKEAAQRAEQEGNARSRIRALLLEAQAAQALGQVRPALQHLELALSVVQQVDDPLLTATVFSSLGRVYLANRQMDAAAHYLYQALEVARELNQPALKATVLNEIGVLHASQAQYREAMAAYRESASLAEEAGQQTLAVHARLNAARAALQLSQHADATVRLDEAAAAVRGLTPSHDKATALITLGLGYADARPGLPDMSDALLLRAAESLKEAAFIAERIGDTRTASYAWGYLGHLYETEHRYKEALALTRRAVFAAQSVTAPESLYRWQWQTGRILAALNRLDEAIASYRSAVETVEPIRPEVTSSAQSPGSTAPMSVRPLYVEYADLLLHRAARMDEGEASQGYLRAARDAIEASKAAELRDYFRDECVDAVQAQIKPLETVSTATAILYPIIFPDRTELLVNFPTGLKRIPVPISSDVITKEIRAFRRTVERRTTREYLPHAQQLFDWLVRPLESDLKKFDITTLVFVPDGPLRTIPMSALHDGQQFLISRYAIAITPGLNLTDPQPINRERIRVLSTGLTEAVQGFPALPHVAEEIDHLRSLYRGDQLLNENFVTPRLERELKENRFGVLHIATHGFFAKDVKQTFLLTFDGKLTMNQLDQLVGVFRFRQEPLELLTLSACRTGAGDDRAALGLAGVAIKAGARSALATLWFINDEASAVLVTEFYRQLRDPSVSKAVALQRAQLKLLEDRVYEHPAYWSPYLLFNNWL
ncbi:MAG TPA: CHAT domain-containing protein, partial [Nitrospiraceae bacterium]|nr:CHAT domain-containing protein [Nitrospiraceae bacterium]